MKEWLMARSNEDTQKFYDDKYFKDGYFAFCCGDWTKALHMLSLLNGPMVEGKTILDAACGHGEFLAAVPDGLNKIGFDLSRHAIQLAKARLKEGVSVSQGTFETFDCESCDYVTCFGSLEHAMEPKKAFRNLFLKLKFNGILLITMPLEFENCLSYIQAEKNQANNERFATAEEWVEYFGLKPEYVINEKQDVYLAYRRTV